MRAYYKSMKSSFLIGDFLPGYSEAFRYKKGKWGSTTNSITPSDLGERFESRAQKYTSRSLGYVTSLQIGLAAALVFILMAFRIPFSGESEFVIEEMRQEIVAMEEIQQTQQQVKPPPPPRPTLPIEVPDDEVIEDLELDLDMALDLDEEIAIATPPPAEEPEEEGEPELFMVVEQPPQIKGGLASLNSALEYPRVAIQSGVEGNVVVQVVVNTDGTPENPQVVRSASPLLDPAAIKAVMAQEFEPGKQRGRAVRTVITIPVRFKLKG